MQLSTKLVEVLNSPHKLLVAPLQSLELLMLPAGSSSTYSCHSGRVQGSSCSALAVIVPCPACCFGRCLLLLVLLLLL